MVFAKKIIEVYLYTLTVRIRNADNHVRFYNSEGRPENNFLKRGVI